MSDIEGEAVQVTARECGKRTSFKVKRKGIAMKRTWPIIGVSNVQVSSEWYRTLLNAANNHPGDSRKRTRSDAKV